MSLLSVTDLRVHFAVDGGTVQAVRGVNFSLSAGETLAIVGESGCGKSVTVASLMGLLPTNGKIVEGSVRYQGRELAGLPEDELNRIRGSEIAMIFQDPMSALNPTMKVGDQIAETLVVHRGVSKQAARAEAVRLLDRTRIPEADKRANQYPFEFSGGMLQRAIIAMGLACGPKILIADEPTTALDVTIQNQVLELMRELQREDQMGIILITHDLGVVARMADRVTVMYAGQVVETASASTLFKHTAHPYTRGLKLAMPSPEQKHGERLTSIAGTPPDLFSPPKGCSYAARCSYVMQGCLEKNPPLEAVSEKVAVVPHQARCWLHDAACTRDIPELFIAKAAGATEQ